MNERAPPGADDALGAGNVISAHVAPDQNRCCQGDAERRASQKYHHRLRIRKGRERRLAEKSTDPKGTHGAIQALQYIRAEDRKCQLDQPAADRAVGK